MTLTDDWQQLASMAKDGLLDPNAIYQTDGSSWRLLYAAIERGWSELAMELVRTGAKLDALDIGRTPLMWACAFENLELVNSFLEAGADVNKPSGALDDDSRETALMIAAGKRALEIVDRLISAGADPQACTRKGLTAAWWATRPVENSACLRSILIAGGKLTGQEIFWPIKRMEVESIKLLLEFDCPINVLSNSRVGSAPKGISALGSAAVWQLPGQPSPKQVEIVRHLIRAGADVNEADETGWTPLMRATVPRGLQVARLLLNEGADPRFCPQNAKHKGKPPIQLAREKKLDAFIDLFDPG